MAKPREIPAPVFESSSSESSDYSNSEPEPAKKGPTRNPAAVLPQKPPAKAPPKDSSSDESSDSEPEAQPAKKAPRIHTPAAALHQKPLAKATARAADSSSDEPSDSGSEPDPQPAKNAPRIAAPASSSDDSFSSDSELDAHVKKPSSSAVAPGLVSAAKKPTLATSPALASPNAGMKRQATSALAPDADGKRSKKIWGKEEGPESAGSKGSKGIALMEKDEEMEKEEKKRVYYGPYGRSVEEWIFREGMELLDDEARSELEKEWKELRKEELKLLMKRFESERLEKISKKISKKD